MLTCLCFGQLPRARLTLMYKKRLNVALNLLKCANAPNTYGKINGVEKTAITLLLVMVVGCAQHKRNEIKSTETVHSG